MAQGFSRNMIEVKQQNMAAVRNLLYRESPVSRVEIAHRLGLTTSTVSNLVGELLARGIVREGTRSDLAEPGKGVGRRPVDIYMNTEARLVLGISMEADATRYCITDLRGRVRRQGVEACVIQWSYKEMLRSIAALLEKLKKSCPQEWSVLLGVGVAIASIVDSEAGVLPTLGAEQPGKGYLGDWRGRPLAEDLQALCGLPVCIENIVRARAVEVMLFYPELLEGETTFAFCHAAYGVTCPMILQRETLRGRDDAAGEIGQMTVEPSRGKLGELGELVGIRGLLRQCRAALAEGNAPRLAEICPEPEQLTIEQILKAQEAGDAAVCAILQQASVYLGITLANLVDFINPRLIFLSGPIFRNPCNIETVRREVEARAYWPSTAPLRLIPIDLGAFGGAIGGAAACVSACFLQADEKAGVQNDWK